MIPQNTINYILQFLLGTTDFPPIGYTNNPNEFNSYKLVIIPCEKLNPSPFPEIDGLPILFGNNRIERVNDTIIVHADLIFATYFLISRSEEKTTTDRDEHGRFCLKKSILSNQQLLFRPIIDEYSILLRNLLNIKVLNSNITINLTHDIDVLTWYRRPRSALAGIIKHRHFQSVISSLKNINNDPAFTFHWIFAQDNKIKGSNKIYFIKSPIEISKFDRPTYNLKGYDFQYVLSLLKDQNVQLGVHPSYYAGSHNSLIISEKRQLEEAIEQQIILSRHHYLRTTSPDDFRKLIEAGITDDYTLAFPDCATFRLATTRHIRWIDPDTQQVTPLTLHPLTIMDVQLTNSNYMNLNYEKALAHIKKLIDITRKFGGEISLLWHNNNFTPLCGCPFHRDLYTQTLDYLAQ